MDKVHENHVKTLVKAGKTYKEIASILKSSFPSVQRGFSEHTIRKYCSTRSIRRANATEVDDLVRQCVEEVGPTYGRKMMAGYIRSRYGVKLGRRKLQSSLSRVSPVYHEQRRNDLVRRANPVPYYAPYHGYKLHIDQNEKLRDFGVTHVCFTDGHSSQVVGMVTMPIKNPITIYNMLFRPLLLSHGIWDMIRADHGTEWCLVLFIQKHLAHIRGYQQCQPYYQSKSTDNLPVERKWVEINHRINYPIKCALIEMQRKLMINMADPLMKYGVSFVSIRLSEVGVARAVEAWNAHPVEDDSQRIPNSRAQFSSRLSPLDSRLVPTTEEAIAMYEAAGGHLTRESSFGEDPLHANARLISEREIRFQQTNNDFSFIYAQLVNGNATYFEAAIISFIDITRQLAV